ncbi:phage holin family protein, partial [Salmonella enterica]|uniref:phage holin family protein n=1 Tax=Salmonella enterica TaxID=28901 RepID=UPI00398C7F43
KRVWGMVVRIGAVVFGVVETARRIEVVELEEEKGKLFQVLLVVGLTMLFAAFGLMSLMVLVICAIDPQYRLNAMIATTVVLLVLALIGAIWTLRNARHSLHLPHRLHDLPPHALLPEPQPA